MRLCCLCCLCSVKRITVCSLSDRVQLMCRSSIRKVFSLHGGQIDISDTKIITLELLISRQTRKKIADAVLTKKSFRLFSVPFFLSKLLFHARLGIEIDRWLIVLSPTPIHC